jgi:hypothetical protein
VKQVDGHEVSFGELDGWLKKALRRRLAWIGAEDQLLMNMVLGREELNGISVSGLLQLSSLRNVAQIILTLEQLSSRLVSSLVVG